MNILNKQAIKKLLQQTASDEKTETYSSFLQKLNIYAGREEIKELKALLFEIGEECFLENQPPINILVSSAPNSLSYKFYDWFVERYWNGKTPHSSKSVWRHRIYVDQKKGLL